MPRIFLAALLSLLLLGMQREALVHEVDHLRARVQVGHDVVLQNIAAGDCLECALLASGAPPLPASAHAVLVVPASSARLPARSTRSPALARVAYYRSRAPPSLA